MFVFFQQWGASKTEPFEPQFSFLELKKHRIVFFRAFPILINKTQVFLFMSKNHQKFHASPSVERLKQLNLAVPDGHGFRCPVAGRAQSRACTARTGRLLAQCLAAAWYRMDTGISWGKG